MIVLGLTGSIGMGKSTTAAMFAQRGVPVWDADAAVARLYGPDGAALPGLARIVPGSVGPDGVDRARLRSAIAEDPALLSRIEALVHPLVASDRAAFLADHRALGTPVVVLDVPLLFETGASALCDRTIVVSAPPEIQRDRVLARGTMTEDQFQAILAKQMTDAEKRLRADHVIDTRTLDAADAAVAAILTDLRGKEADARDRA